MMRYGMPNSECLSTKHHLQSKFRSKREERSTYLPSQQYSMLIFRIILLLLVPNFKLVAAFSASPQTSLFEGISSFFNSQSNFGAENKLKTKRQELKNDLLELCKDSKVSRDEVEKVIGQLKEVQPFENTSTSTLLQKEWLL